MQRKRKLEIRHFSGYYYVEAFLFKGLALEGEMLTTCQRSTSRLCAFG